jgi:hypothetical protein
MYLGVMSAEGVGQPVCINMTMNLEEYLTILNGNLQQSSHKLGLKSKLIFWLDNDQKHTIKIFA